MAIKALQDIIKINKKIKIGHDNGTISYRNYSETVKPSIEEFKIKYHNTPNKYLKNYLSPLFEGLNEGYELKNYQHYGNNNLHEFVWACIYYKYPNIKSLYASSSPQLYILVHSNGLKFGLDYGAQIENNSPLVEGVKKNSEIQELIIKLNQSIPAYKLSQGADYLANKTDLISLNSADQINENWSNNIHLIKQFDTNSIPDSIDLEISKTLSDLKSLFIKICELNLPKEEETIEHQSFLNIKPFRLENFVEQINNSGLFFSRSLLSRFVASLITKPFVILSGLSGSGKTKLAQAFVQWICQDESQYRIIPVGADWTNREALLGYPNALKPEEYVKPDSGVLDLIIQANNQQELPHFLILDEMNLSHVERYFADFLSAMESKEEIPLYAEGTVENGVPAKLKIPSNFFIIGTVNIDETTNMFSPKVLDRANTIEFRVTQDEMKNFLSNIKEINMDAITSKGAGMAKSFMDMAGSKEFSTTDIDTINTELIHFFGELKKTGAEFGYRSASEILNLIHQLSIIDNTLTTHQKIDIAIIQKLLPKLHGSRRKLCPVLETLGSFCISDDIKIIKDIFEKPDFDFNSRSVLYPLSLEKISRMYRGAIDNGFASFAEA
ncbi:AAA family ATPase [Maribacter polysiphoniae]|uniref:AAA family ATPase n=1 Tax=Maribacter polysiphoniae TaxID=429344 RepID=A0A316E5E7_9FLAO|nr:AAA family ATPase [Maribacter polysiphoniae]MBD1259308.1 AAA family ATPase [Maribacter polysiphoniae]PWK24868.1 dynein-related subfamily AAA family protein [Maribacter polysiphoniae]